MDDFDLPDWIRYGLYTAIITARFNPPTNPMLILNYEYYRTTGNILHEIIGRDYPDVTHNRGMSMRRGTITYLFDNDGYHYAEHIHRTAPTITLTDTKRPSINMQYVVTNDITLTLDPETRCHWIMTVPFAEVP